MPEFETPLGLRAPNGEAWSIKIPDTGTASGNLMFIANSLTGNEPAARTMMLINDETGNVGIGTQNPAARLDVEGTFRVNRGTLFSKIQAGTATVGSSSSQRKNIVVSFPGSFLIPPKIIAIARGGNYPDTFAVTTTAISTTQFSVNVLRLDRSSGWGQNLKLDWMAWQ
jgi:hypothetical protein